MAIPKKKDKKYKESLSANVSTLKVHLGRFLRQVKQGEEVIVLDRQLPVAKIVAYSGEAETVQEIAPTQSWDDFLRLMADNERKRKFVPLKRSSLSYLLEDRGDD